MKKIKYWLSLILILLVSGSIFCGEIYAKNVQEIKNTPPTANFKVRKNPNVKLLIFSDYTGAELANLTNSITEMKSELANDAKITVEYAAPKTITLGRQYGQYKEVSWGMLGHVSYTWSGSQASGGETTVFNKKAETEKFSYSPVITLPEGEKPPSAVYQKPTNYYYSIKRTDGMFGGGKDREYSFYSSEGGMCQGRLSLWIEYSYASGSGGVCGLRSFDTEPEFTFDDNWSVYSSYNTSVTNTVTGWDLSAVNYSVPEGTDTYLVFALKDKDTDYYHKSGTYALGELRSDSSLGKLVSYGDVKVYSICPKELENTSLSYNPAYPVSFTGKKQDITLKELMDLSHGGRSLGDNNTAGLTKSISESIKKLGESMDMQTASLTILAKEEEVKYDAAYSDVENDPKYAERWQYTHLDSYFDNDNGIVDFSGKWLNEPVDSFNKVGRYKAVCQFRDNPENSSEFEKYRKWSQISPSVTLIVHRRPYARFNTIITSKWGRNVNLSYLDRSYDLDHNISRADKGIAARSWQYKKSTSSEWINGKPESLTYNSGIYQIKLNVKDIEGAWSKAFIDTIDTANLPPSVDADPSSYDGLGGVNIRITGSDNGENDFSYMRYAITKSTTAPAEAQWVKVANGAKTKDIEINTEGTFYLYMEAYDTAGQVGKNMTGPYKVMLNRPPHVTITGTTPVCIYEGDDVTVNFKATDPDLDTLSCRILIKKGANIIWSGTKTVTPSGGIYPDVSMQTMQNIRAGRYVVEITATDDRGMSGTDTYAFTVNELTISGKVDHTSTWKANWQKYNRHMAKAGKQTYGSDTFFTGEKYILGAETTSIAAGSSVTAVKVSVKILERPYSPVWLKRHDVNSFNGQMWNQDMRGKRWRGMYATFLFTVTYSNGTVKTDSVRTYVVDDDYWRVRMAF